VALVDWEQRKALVRFRADQGTLKALALHPERRWVAAVGRSGSQDLGRLFGQCLLQIGQEGQNLAFSADGKLLIVARSPTDGLRQLHRRGSLAPRRARISSSTLLTVDANNALPGRHLGRITCTSWTA